MAVPVPIPVIAQLPPAPRRNDGPPDFVLKADAMIASLHPLVQQINIALQWISGQLTDTQASEQAAAVSARAAADSVTEAVRQVGLATEQAVVAGRERKGAEAARDSTEVVAAAVQSAAGFPALAGHAAHALRVKLDESGVEFAEVGQEIGDVLITRRSAPPPGYVLPGTVYAQAAYPELFALTGIREVNNDGTNFAKIADIPAAMNDFRSLTMGKDGVAIITGPSGAGGTPPGTAYRSKDLGVTWELIPKLHGIGIISDRYINTDKQGNWVVHVESSTGNNNYVMYTSGDNGVTWVQRVSPVVGGVPGMSASGSAGQFVVISSASPYKILMSEDAGVTWSTRMSMRTGTLQWVSDSTWIVGDQLSLDGLRSANDNSGMNGFVTGGGVLANRGPNSIGVLARSQRGTDTYSTEIIGTALRVDPQGCIYAFNKRSDLSLAGYGTDLVYKSYDAGVTWGKYPAAMPLDFVSLTDMVGMSLDGTWLAARIQAKVIYRATRLYNYDAATQFKTPHAKAPASMYAYIKAKKV